MASSLAPTPITSAASAVRALADTLTDHERTLRRVHRGLPVGGTRTEVAWALDRLGEFHGDLTRVLAALAELDS